MSKFIQPKYKKYKEYKKILFFALFILMTKASINSGFSETLKGSVSEQGTRNNNNDGLTRRDLDYKTDPFANDNDENSGILSAPDSAFKIDAPRQPIKPKKGFNLNAVQEMPLTQNMGPLTPIMPSASPWDGENESLPPLPRQMQAPQNQPRMMSQDPDMSPEMQVAWDAWHKRVAEAIYTRFNFLAKLGFRHSPPLLCKVSYGVTRDGHIVNIQVTEKSSNVLFNVIVFQTVKSLDGDINLLQFPMGSHRNFVPKVGTFTQNYGGDGFKYTVGDRESLNPQNPQ